MTTGTEEVTDTIHTDLCVIGAGPAGISVVRELQGSGLRVCLVESGAADVDRRLQRQNRGESAGYPIHRLDRSRLRAFGGTVRHPSLATEGWAARPLDPIDFAARPGLPFTGWPFGREHMDPYYSRAFAACRMKLHDYEPSTWTDENSPMLPLEGSDVDTTLFHYAPAGFHRSLAELTASSDVRVLLRSRVVDLVTKAGAGRVVERVVVRRNDGSRLVVRPRAVVLATGGIENARLLLLADSLRGIGNENDLVGRFFAERLSAHAGHVVDTSPDLVDRAELYRLRTVQDSLMQGVLRVKDGVQYDRQLLNCAFFLVPRPESVISAAVRSLATLRKVAERRPLLETTGAHLRNVAAGPGDLVDFASSRLRSARQVLTVRAQGEQAPDPESRVTLGVSRDDLGQPVARVTWRIDDANRTSVSTSLGIVDSALRSRGIGRVEDTLGSDARGSLFEGNHHHLGTTRMHRDPRQGVVDANCRVHSVANLYLAGSSVFPTYGASNPTLTIVALALRLADHLRGELGAAPASVDGRHEVAPE